MSRGQVSPTCLQHVLENVSMAIRLPCGHGQQRLISTLNVYSSLFMLMGFSAFLLLDQFYFSRPIQCEGKQVELKRTSRPGYRERWRRR